MNSASNFDLRAVYDEIEKNIEFRANFWSGNVKLA
jgi:hypothetical protein